MAAAEASSSSSSSGNEEFYCRYYQGHKGKFGHEFIEFEVLPSGVLKYANNSAYKSKGQDVIRKLVTVSPAVVAELKRIIVESEVTKEDDNNWPEPDVVGEQNLEIKIGNEHISGVGWAQIITTANTKSSTLCQHSISGEYAIRSVPSSAE